jgi:hypothetical protein
MKLIGELIKVAGKSAAESAVTGGACAVAMAAIGTLVFCKSKDSLKKIDGKSFGPYSGQNSRSLKRWKAEKAKTEVGRAAKMFFSPVTEAGVKYFEGFERGMRQLYDRTDIMKPTKAILGVK